MNAIIFSAVLLAILFVTSYLVRRRFGVLGLALAAGALISTYFAESLTPLIIDQGFVLVSPPLGTVVEAILILAPALVLLFSGPSYHERIPRIIGSALFALLAFAFLLSPLSSALALDQTSEPVFEILTSLQPGVIVTGLSVAVIDVLLTHTGRKKFKKGEH